MLRRATGRGHGGENLPFTPGRLFGIPPPSQPNTAHVYWTGADDRPRPATPPSREEVMRHRAPWALSLALLAGLGAAAVAQEPAPPNQPKQNGSWLPNLWPFGQQPQKKAEAPPAA